MTRLSPRAFALAIALSTALPACGAIAAPPLRAVSESPSDAVRVILKARKLLTTADVVCGGAVTLQSDEALLLGLTRKNVKFMIDRNQFQAIERELAFETADESRARDFCARARSSKPMLLMRVRQSAHTLGMDTLGL